MGVDRPSKQGRTFFFWWHSDPKKKKKERKKKSQKRAYFQTLKLQLKFLDFAQKQANKHKKEPILHDFSKIKTVFS